MPVAKGPKLTARQALVASIVGVVAAAGLLAFAVFVLSRSNDVKVKLGDSTFQRVNAAESAARIRKGGPVLYSDVSGGTRDVYLQHLGNDDDKNWYAFDARPAGQPRACFVEWQADRRLFVANDKCSNPGATYPQTGDGLRQYPTAVKDNRVIVDFNPQAGSTSSSPTTSEAK